MKRHCLVVDVYMYLLYMQWCEHLCCVAVAVCTERWEVLQNLGNNGGIFHVASSLDECQDICLLDPDCVAIDVSEQDPFFCFTHTNQSLLENTYSSQFISQHRLLERCQIGEKSGKSTIITRT